MKYFSFTFLIVLCIFYSTLQAQNIDSLNIKALSTVEGERLSALGILGDYYYYKEPKKI